jgi:hypothetical protein
MSILEVEVQDDTTKIIKTLVNLGVPSNLKGYYYLLHAIRDVLGDDTIRPSNDIYPTIGDKYNVSPGSVETAIRKAIQVCITRITPEQWVTVFGREKSVVLNNKDTMKNSTFIYGVAEYLKIELRR